MSPKIAKRRLVDVLLERAVGDRDPIACSGFDVGRSGGAVGEIQMPPRADVDLPKVR